MGEAMYYMKIRFNTAEEAKNQLESIRSFFLEGSKSHDYWQDNRDKYWEPSRPVNPNPNQHREKADKNFPFWDNFKSQFPQVYEYLSDFCECKDYNNELAGVLDFGEEEDIQCMDIDEKYIYYNSTVWHFADWEYLRKYIIKKFGAVNCGYISDEYIEPFDLIEI